VATIEVEDIEENKNKKEFISLEVILSPLTSTPSVRWNHDLEFNYIKSKIKTESKLEGSDLFKKALSKLLRQFIDKLDFSDKFYLLKKLCNQS